MDGLFSLSSQFDLLYTKNRDDDFIDRFNHGFTSILLVLCALFISAKQYLGDPITCWVNKEFSKAWKQYAENYCWVQNTYFIPHDVDLPNKHTYRNERQLSYYQWVPYVLILQAFMFYCPKLVWRLLNWQSGINIQEIINKAMNVCFEIRSIPLQENAEEQNIDSDELKIKSDVENNMSKTNKCQNPEPLVPNDIKNIAHHLETSIDSISESKSMIKKIFGSILFCFSGSRQYGLYLMNLYIFTKLLYITNVICQFFILNRFIGSSYIFFGFQILKDISEGKDWKTTGSFPRITMCDFQIRSLGNRLNYTVQCVLPINLFNEKIYIFIWFWFVFVAIITIISLFQWLMRMLYFNRRNFIKNIIVKSQSNWSNSDNSFLEEFLTKRLKSDGMLLIYLIYLNAGDIVTKEIIQILWFWHCRRNNLNKKDLFSSIDANNMDSTENDQFL